MASRTYTPVIKIVTVNADQAHAFRRFTAEIGRWWPLASHSVDGAKAETVSMEEGVGGRIVEHGRDGREAVWGTITSWDPPRRVAFSWHPGDDPARATSVEVRFVAFGSGMTRVELEHRGFENLGADARKARRGYPIGWAYVLGLYAERRGLFMTTVTWLSAVLMWVARRRVSA